MASKKNEEFCIDNFILITPRKAHFKKKTKIFSVPLEPSGRTQQQNEVPSALLSSGGKRVVAEIAVEVCPASGSDLGICPPAREGFPLEPTYEGVLLRRSQGVEC
jgi:hypothetical protein